MSEPPGSIGEVLESLKPYRHWDRWRMELAEGAALLDNRLSLCLAIHHGKESEHILSLHQEVFWRLPVEVRIGLLEDALWRTGLHDEVPFLAPSMRAIFRIRNTVAHSVSRGESKEFIVLASVKRGRVELTEFGADHLKWAIRTGEHCQLYFHRIEGRIGGMDAWANLHGFAER
jgi:hypothetical protein